MATPDLKQLRLSEDVQNAEQLRMYAASLLAKGWKIDDDNMGLEATFKFPNYTKAVDFLTTMHVHSKIHNHHAEIFHSYDLVYLHWTTHRPRGLSDKDVAMAQICHDFCVSLKGEYKEDVTRMREIANVIDRIKD